MSSEIRIKKTTRKRWAWPVVGFVLLVSLSTLAYMIAPATIVFIRDVAPQFNPAGMPPPQLRLFVAVMLFGIMVTIVAFIVAVLAPKRKDTVKYADLEKERQAMYDEKKRRKLNARKLAHKMREDSRKRQQ